MNSITKHERTINVHGVEARAFGVVEAPNGRILNQVIKAARQYRENGHIYSITVHLRFDDSCGNGHETFSATATIREDGRDFIGGCCHDEITRHFPELAHLMKWHLVSTDGPMHYEANTIYHADEHGPDSAWIYYTDSDPLGLSKGERILCYTSRAKAQEAEGKPGYRVEWDAKTAKERNLNHARSSAVWPEATDEDLTQDPKALRAALRARLPALMAAFKADMIAAGFKWPERIS